MNKKSPETVKLPKKRNNDLRMQLQTARRDVQKLENIVQLHEEEV